MNTKNQLFALLFTTTFIFTACSCIEIELILPPPNQTDEGVEINGVVWATRNVDMPGTFAPYPESAGMFYQWNRRVGWSSTDPMKNSIGGTAWNSSTTAGIYWTRANDPCPAGWRVPTQAELTNLRNQPSTWTTRNGINGRLFGTVPNQIFLPAIDNRNGVDGHISNAYTTFGRYWSSTHHDIDFARDLWFYSGGVGVDWNWQAHGHSVRCVAEN